MAATRDPPHWPAEVAVPRRAVPRRGAIPVCETRLLTVAEIDGWLAAAAPGEALVYCTGAFLPPGPSAERVKALLDARRVHHRQRRAEGCLGTDYLIVKAEAPPAAPAAPAAGDEATEAIHAALARCAARGRRAYSDAELARIAGLATRHQAQWRVRKLADAGRLAVETVAGPDGTPWRVVTVGRRRTAAPPESREGGTDAD